MKAYWDSSALVLAAEKADLMDRLIAERGFTRRHALAETFSALTGKMEIRMDADFAARMLKEMSVDLDFVELSTDEILAAMADCRKLGVRGGRIHDLLHAVAAKKSNCDVLITGDTKDFEGLVPGLRLEIIS